MSVSDDQNNDKLNTVGLFLRAMVDREPGKRKVKASKAALIDLAQLDMGDSSDDSDFNVDEAKLNEDDDISINSDPDNGESSGGSGSEDEEEGEEEESDGPPVEQPSGQHLTVQELLERAEKKQKADIAMGHPKVLVCAVCLGDNSDDANEIVTCDGWCHVSVHEGCYGVSDSVSVSSTVSSSSTEPWFCDACKAGVRNPTCELCPNLGYSIFKETEMGRWVHLVCALYVPGVAFSEVDKLSFPTLFEMAYSRYGSKVCSLCEDARFAKTGVCIGCDAGMCRSYFHVTCAQKEGLLSEVNHGEADQADPYYAHCKLHTDRELIRKRKRNWLTLQLHTKQSDPVNPKEQSRLERKLCKYRDKYSQNKSSRPTPWYPTQKMPRALSTCASLFRTLLNKTKMMGLSTETPEAEIIPMGDIRKKWHIAPAFNNEFISYYLDRSQRLKELKGKLEGLLQENVQLNVEQNKLKTLLQQSQIENKAAVEKKDLLLSKSLAMHNLLKGLAGRPLPLPPVVAALHNPPLPVATPKPTSGGRETRRIITKAAAKMIADPPAPIIPPEKLFTTTKAVPEVAPALINAAAKSPSSAARNDEVGVHSCTVCKQQTDQHLQIQCDTCVLYYHLCCLDPPLTRMPKKTKQMGWQCSDCCKSSDSEKLTEVDMMAPRRLRRVIKEPAKFSPSMPQEGKGTAEKSPPAVAPASLPSDTPESPSAKPNTAKTLKRRRSSDGTKKNAPPTATTAKKFKKASDKTTSDMQETETKSTTPCGRGKRSNAEQPKKAEPKNEDEVEKGQGKVEGTTKGNLKKCYDSKEKRTTIPSSAENSSGKMDSQKSEFPPNADHEMSNSPAKVDPQRYDSESNPLNADSSAMSDSQRLDSAKTDSQKPESSTKLDSQRNEPPLRTRARSSAAENDGSTSKPEDVMAVSSATPQVTITPTYAPVCASNTPSTSPEISLSITPTSIPPTSSIASIPTTILNNTVSLACQVTPVSSVPVTALPAVPVMTASITPVPAMAASVTPHPLDVSADSLPSAASLHSPTSESLYSFEEDNNPHSPRKEKKHRDGSKKKKKDKDKDKNGDKGEKKRKKHHHYWDTHSQSSEMLAPLRLKIKPLPPRPAAEETASQSASAASPSSYAQAFPSLIADSKSWPSDVTQSTNSLPTAPIPSISEGANAPPPGYPPLPPGYNLAQPLLMDAEKFLNDKNNSGTLGSRRNSNNSSTPSTPSSSAGGTKRKSESAPGQQFSKCDVCKETGGVTNTVECDDCHKAYHFNCLDPPLKKTPKRRGYSWFCEDCEPSK